MGQKAKGMMQHIRLLLVDDEVDFRQTLANRLRKRGLTPEQAGNGEECLSILEQKPMDVVVLDVKMPGITGIEVLEHIKKKYPKTEVILLTGHASTRDGVEGIKSGAFDYLTKPIEVEHLLGKIKQASEKISRAEKIRQWEQKLKEVEFRAKMAQQMMATERLASLGTLATGVAHEINNPLAIMKESAGYMRLILKREELAEMPRKQDFELALTKIEGGVERARRITHQLLGAARKDDSVLSEVNLRELVNEAVQLVYREAANKDIEIIQKTDPSLNAIWSYPYQLRQVLINLLTNAIHATDSGGRITIILESIGDEAALTVSDTGEGIPRENLGRIFEPFFTTKSPDEGTGLGLFVTRGIIEKLGGAVNVESRIGHGSSFCVRLPKNDKHKDTLGKNNCVGLSDK
jgi:signal transduction histidine kinase